ncbi:hypothetical protein JTB14_024385 [Gonioctena quinquepunctata]|nr:hypothetical protein JTB14_024385 [Gonioctena quinquepunctata]
MGYDVTYTIRENRNLKNCPIILKKAVKKKNRGEIAPVLDKLNGITLVGWVDNNVVNDILRREIVKAYKISQSSENWWQTIKQCIE